jgi:hypothetical protein
VSVKKLKRKTHSHHAIGQRVKYAAQMLRLNGAVMSSTALRIVATGHRVKLWR